MSKRRRDCSASFGSYGKTPLPCTSSLESEANSSHPPATAEQMKEWEDARCPVCMEHPHNAVLLICSSHFKGCRPYMCNTSHRHSNCLDQFSKSFAEASNANSLEDGQPHAELSDVLILPTDAQDEGKTQAPNNFLSMHTLKQKLICPLCRGQISGWIVVQAARELMNAKTRSCACEACDFGGNYRDLRNHARIEHPQVCPSEVDPERQQNWRQLERQRDIGDMLSIIRSSLGLGEVDEDLIVEHPQDGQQNWGQLDRQDMVGQDGGDVDAIPPLREHNGFDAMFLLFEVWLRPSARPRSTLSSGAFRPRLRRVPRQRTNEARARNVPMEDEESSGSDIAWSGTSRPRIWRVSRTNEAQVSYVPIEDDESSRSDLSWSTGPRRLRRRLPTPEDEI